MKNKLKLSVIFIMIFLVIFQVSVFGAETTWGEQTISTSTTKQISGTVLMNGTTTINSGVTLTIVLEDGASSDAIIKRNFGTVDVHQNMFTLLAGSKLIIKGNSTNKIIIDGGNTFTLTPASDNKDVSTGLNYSGCAISVTESQLELENVTIQNMYAAQISTTQLASVIKVIGTDEAANIINLRNVCVKNCLNRNDDSPIRLKGFVAMSNCEFIDCCTDAKYGGVIKAGGSSVFCQLTMNDCFASGNYSSGWGGAILWAAGGTATVNDVIQTASAKLSNCTFTDNAARYLGGAISSEATMTLENCIIKNNTAMAGGGIATFPFTLNEDETEDVDACGLKLGEGNQITNNFAIAAERFIPDITITTTNTTGTSFPAGGGGIWCLMNKDKWTCTLTVDEGNVISNNKTNGTGGGIIVYKEIGGETKLVITGAEVTSNEAPKGGGVALHNAEIEINGGKISHNIGTLGGAVYIENGTFEMNDGSIEECTAIENGGAIYLSAGDFVLSGGNIGKIENDKNLGNKAIKGGAAYVIGGTFTMNGGIIEGNTATNSGGGMQISDGNVYITGGKISSNVARGEETDYGSDVGYGGGIFVDGGEIVSITGGEISNNIAAKNGGGIEIKTDKVVTVDVYSGSFIKNVADECGGAVGIDCDNGTINVGKEDCDGSNNDHIHPVLLGNLAGKQGGGFYMSGKNASLNIYCGSVDNNIVVDIENNFDQSSGTVTVYDGAQIGEENEGVIVIGGTFVDKRNQDEQKISITYYCNYEGSVENKQATVTKDAEITLPGDIFGIEDYEVIGWTTHPYNTTDAEYRAGEIIQMTESIELYAVWILDKKYEPSYIIVIPAEINFENETDIMIFDIAATLNFFPRSKLLNINLSEEDYKLKYYAGGNIKDTISYDLMKDEKKINVGEVAATFNSNTALISYEGVEKLILAITEEPKYMGQYVGDLTFFVSIDGYKNLEAKKKYGVTYDNIANSNIYPKKAVENESFSVTFADNISNIAIKMNGNILNSSEYSYSNRKLIINNVIGDIEIMSCVLNFAGSTVSEIFEISTIDYTSNSITYVGKTKSGVEYITIPVTNLTVGATYELAFSETNNYLNVEDSNYLRKYDYGNWVTNSSSTPTSLPTVAWHTKENGSKYNQKIKFTATSETMYWKWILALCKDSMSSECRIYDVSLNKINSIYPNVNTNEATFVTNGKYTVTLNNDMRLGFSATGGSAAEKVNIPIKNLEVGKKYKLKFSEYNDGAFYASTSNYYYGCSVLSSPDNTTSSMVPTWICKETGFIEDQSIIFTATATTMYWVWTLQDIKDGTEYNFEFYNIDVEEC